MSTTDTTDIKEVVKQKYGEAALRVKSGGSSCCGATASAGCCDPITANLYDATQAGQIPEEALLASLGCGNPTALAQLNPGETVLDLGSGGGIDVLLSARRVGPTGKAYGLDMTDEMLALANENKRKVGHRERRVSEGRDREHPPARQFRRRHHFQLRDQSLRRQRQSSARSLPRSEAGRPFRGVRRCHSRRDSARDSSERSGLGRLHRRRAGRKRLPQANWRRRASSRLTSSPRVSTAPRTRANSSRGRESTLTPSLRKSTENF